MIVLTILPMLPSSAAVAASPDVLPDLVATAPTNPRPVVEPLGDGQDHFIVRFDGYIHNIGPGPLEIRGSNPVNGVMTVSGQRIYRQDSKFHDDNSRHPTIKFETADGHRHWHVQNATRFGLWNEAGTVEVGRGAKVGFCLEDVRQVESSSSSDAYSSAATDNCKAGQRNASSVFEGISPGWTDFYAAKLPFQWVDVSDVAPGSYRLGEQVDPDNLFLEGNEANNGPAFTPEIVTVPGWFPSSGTVTARKPQATILLGAQRFGNAGSAAFKIESSPKHGKLSSTPGAPAYQVLYAPNPGFEGTDTFTFSARDSSSPFPLHPPVAVVRVKVPGSPVHAFKKLRLLTKVRFSRKGRFITVRGRAKRTGILRLRIKKGKRRLGSCTKRARSRHSFRCRIKLRKGASPLGAKVVVSLLVNGRPTAVDVFRVPRRLGR